MQHPFLLLIAAKLSLTGWLDWKWRLWPVPTWLAVQRRRAVFLMTLYYSINDMKYFRINTIAPQPCHSRVCWVLLQIWPMVVILAENGAHGMCRLGGWYNWENLYFSWCYVIVSMIRNTPKCLYYTSAVPHPCLLLIATILVLAGSLGWKWSLWPVPNWFTIQQSKSVLFLILYYSINDIKYFRNICITPHLCHSQFCYLLLQIWSMVDFWAENGACGLC